MGRGRGAVRRLVTATVVGLVAPIAMAPVMSTASATAATTVVVSNELELRTAVAGTDTTIVLATGTITLTGGELTIGRSLTIQGAGPGERAGDFVIDAVGGAGLVVNADDVTLRGLTVKNASKPNGTGAAITVKSGKVGFLLVDSSIEGNVAREGAGITIAKNAQAEVRRSTFVGNVAERKGGGIRVDGDLTLVNSTFTENLAQSGGAISVAGTAKVSFSTFVDNTSNTQKGAGVDRNGGTLVITGSILTKANQASTDGSDCSGNPDLIGPNYVGNAQGCNPDASVLIGTDPAVGPLQLEPLRDNSGPTRTIAILTGTAADGAAKITDTLNQCRQIGVGASGPTLGMQIATDQRGVIRPQPDGGDCDLGAYEITDLDVGVVLSSDTNTPFVGAELLPADAITSSVIANDRLFGDTLVASPLEAFPIDAAPLNAFPLEAFPLEAFPLEAFPLDAFATAAAPLEAFPLEAFPLEAFPLEAFPLSDLVLTEGTWEDLLAGTEFDGAPIQSLTLGEVIAVPGVAALSLGQLNLEGTPLNAFPLNAFLLQSVPLEAFPLEAFGEGLADGDWCAVLTEFCDSASVSYAELYALDPPMTLASLSLAGVPLEAFPLEAFPLEAFPLEAFPLNAFPLEAFSLGAFEWQASPLEAFPLEAFPLEAFGDVIDCSLLPGGTCAGATLGDAATAGAFVIGATLGDLGNLFQAYPEALDVLAALGITLADLMAGVIPSGSIPWEQLDLSTLGLQNAADPNRWTFHYLADVTLTERAESLTLELTLPSGFAYGTTGTTIDGVPLDPAAVSLRCSDPASTDCRDAATVVVIQLTDVTGGTRRVSIPSRAGFVIRSGALADVEVTATAGTTEATASDDHSVDVIAPPDSGPRPIVQSGNPCGAEDGDANLGWAPSATTEVDLYSFTVSEAAARCGLRADIFLGNLPVDFDLTLFGPVSAPLRGEPNSTMGYLDDVTLDLNPFDDEIQADPVQDIPQRLPDDIGVNPDDYAVVAISANRDQFDDRIRTGSLRQGTYFIQVSPYNGASSNEPYSLRMRTDASVAPLECAALPTPTAPTGSRPSAESLPPGTNTLFLVNEQLLEFTYGTQAKNDIVAAAQRVAAAAELGVIGAVIAVDADTDVQAAYASRFADPCDPFAANDVVSAIGAVIDEYTSARSTIENIVIVGDDRQIPMANIVDDANFANERTFSQEFDVANESTAALAAGMYRSDDPYGADAGIRIRDHELFLPTRAVGRLVESPAEIIASLDRYVDFGGQLDDDTTRNAFQSGYDFLQDGAELNADNLAAGGFEVDPLFVDENNPATLWSDDDLIGALSSRYDVIGLHAHFDENHALPAEQDEFGIGSDDELLRSDELPLSADSSVVYSMGCHSGWNYSDIQVGGPAPDWAHELTGLRDNVFMGNTGFGYGDTERIALTEELTALFADEVGQDGSIGAAWVAAKQRMAQDLLVVDAYQEKALQQFIFFGLPMFHVDTAPPDLSGVQPLATVALAAEPTLASDPNGQPVWRIDAFNPTAGPDAFRLNTTPDGNYYSLPSEEESSGAQPGLDGGVLTVNGHPVEPLRTVVVPSIAGMRAQDALVVELTSEDVDGDFDPLFFWASPNFGGPRPEWTDGSFPAEIAAVRTSRVRGETQQQALLAAGQYRAYDGTPDLGKQRLHTQIGAEVYYVPDTVTDFTPPLIRRSSAFVDQGLVRFEVDVDASATRVFVLYRAEGANEWQPLDLARLGGLWGGVGPLDQAGGARIEYFVQAPDLNGNVAISNSKSKNFLAAAPADISLLTLQASASPDDQPINDEDWFTGAVDVTAFVNGNEAVVGDDVVIRVDASPFADYVGSITIGDDGTYLVTAIDGTGAFAALDVKIDSTPPIAAVEVPITWSRDPIDVTFDATDEGSGVATIHYTLDGSIPTTDSPTFDPATPPTVDTEGVTARAIAVDVAGNVSDVADGDVPIDVTATAPTPTLSNLDVDGAVGSGGTVVAIYACADALSGVDSCVLTVDGTAYGDATSASLPTDTLGTFDAVVTLTDVAGNSATASASYTVEDRTPPTATVSLSGTIFGLGELDTNPPTATFSCDDAAPSSGITGCELQVLDGDGTIVAGSSADPSTLSGSYVLPVDVLQTPGDYRVVVTATDAANNTSEATGASIADFEIVDDIDPTPSLVLVGIDENDAVGGNDDLTADYACGDNIAVAGCVLDVRDPTTGAVIAVLDTSDGSLTADIPLPTDTLGTFDVVVTATDTTGNTATATETYVVEDRTPPTATLSLDGTSFGLAQLDTDPPTASFSCDDAAPSSGLTSCVLEVRNADGDVLASVEADPSSPSGTFDLPTTVLQTPGGYTVVVTATDAASNTSADTTVSTAIFEIVDDIDPVATLALIGLDLDLAVGANGLVDGEYSCSDNIAVAGCVLDVRDPTTGAVIAVLDTSDGSLTADIPLPTDTLGTFDVVVTATDTTGNTATATETYVVEDRTPPTVSLSMNDTSFGLSTIASAPPVATFGCDDAAPSSGLTCELDVLDASGAVVASATTSSYAIPSAALQTPGTYTVVVTATDGVGGSASTSTTFTVFDDVAPFGSLVVDPGVVGVGDLVTVDYTCDDGIALESCTLQVLNPDGSVAATSTSTSSDGGPLSGTVVLPSDSLGVFTVTLDLTDADGNTGSTQATYTVEDRVPPTATLALDGSFGLSTVVADPPTATFSCDDALPSSGLSCELQVLDAANVVVASASSDGTESTFTLPATLLATPADLYTVIVTATDGNNAPVTVSDIYAIADDIVPDIELTVTPTTLPDGADGLAVDYTCSDNVALVSCDLQILNPDGSVADESTATNVPGIGAPISGTVTIPTATTGSYTATVTATDTWGNVNAVTETSTYLPEICFDALYDETQPKSVGTNYTIRISPCDPDLNRQARQLELMATAIVSQDGTQFFDPGVNDSGSANGDELYLFRYVRKDGFIYNLNTTNLIGIIDPAPAGELYELVFDVFRIESDGTKTLLGVGRAPFTLTP